MIKSASKVYFFFQTNQNNKLIKVLEMTKVRHLFIYLFGKNYIHIGLSYGFNHILCNRSKKKLQLMGKTYNKTALLLHLMKEDYN